MITFDRLYTRTSYTHASLNMDTLDERRKKHVSVQVYKYLNGKGPTACRDMFTYVSDYHDVNTRSSNKSELVIPKLNLTLAQRNIRYFGTKVWKSIPEDIKTAPSLKTFKKEYMLPSLTK